MTEDQRVDHADQAEDLPASDAENPPKRKRRKRRRGKRGGDADAPAPNNGNEHGEPSSGRRKKGRGKRRRRGGDQQAEREPERRRPEPPTEHMPEVFAVDTTFDQLGLTGGVLDAINEYGFKHPTHIQARLIPVALTGKDILGQAKTGTGKTLSFGLPLLHMVEPGAAYSALILAPTRELAIQIHQDLADFGKHTELTSVPVYGGQSINTQADKLDQRPEIIVGTPGRVMDMVRRGHMTFDDVRFVVLDEVDRMLDIGFREDIRRILSQCPKPRQTIFVSATFTDEIERLARKQMHDPEKLVVSSGSLTVELVQQSYVTVPPWDKKRMLAHLLTHEEPALTLVFCRMKRTVDDVVRYLDRKGIAAHAIHGDMTQGARNKTMEKFRKGDLAVLVASDLASRGLDVEGITHVVNYDLPEDPDLYVHRIGRTARAGRDGIAWSLVTPSQGTLLTEIEMLVNTEIPSKEYPDFEPRERPADWKDELPPNHYVVEGVDKQHENRYVSKSPEQVTKDMDADKLAAKFPGGVVPKKLPPRTMGGRARTRRGR